MSDRGGIVGPGIAPVKPIAATALRQVHFLQQSLEARVGVVWVKNGCA